jgi:hypothetical protein
MEDFNILGLAEISGKKGKEKRKEKKEERKEKKQEKKEDRKERKQEKKTERKENKAKKKEIKKLPKKERKEAKKIFRKDKREQRGGSVLKKVALAVPRKGFAVVLELNLFKLANKFVQAYQKNPDKVKKFASRFGYRWSNFKSYVNKGAKTGQISGFRLMDEFGEPVAVTAIASASAIIGSAVAFLKSIGIEPESELKNLIAGDPDKFQDDPGLQSSDPEPGATAPPPPSEIDKQNESPSGGGMGLLLPLGLGAGLLYFLTTQKK